MDQKWISPKVITGPAATGDYYFKRPYINDQIWEILAKGTHILLVAPRRVGKSSVMKDLETLCPEGWTCIYQDLEGTSSEQDFYRRFYNLLLICLKKNRSLEALKKLIKTKTIKKIGTTGVEFETRDIDYLDEINHLLPKLEELEGNVVLLLDEFPEVLNNLKKKDETAAAINILNNLREWRQTYNSTRLAIVFAGSVGLHHVVSSIDRPKSINDLHSYPIGALNIEEAKSFVAYFTKEATVKYDEKVTQFLLDKIGDYLPYYISLMLYEIDRLARQNNEPTPTEVIIMTAFDNIVKEHKNFADWELRLKQYHADDFPFMKRILIHIAHHESISIPELYDISKEYERDETYIKIMGTLETDGYLKTSDNTTFTFLSPFLKAYWYNNNPIHNG